MDEYASQLGIAMYQVNHVCYSSPLPSCGRACYSFYVQWGQNGFGQWNMS